MSICFDEELKAGGFPDTAESLASQHARGRWCRVMSMGTRIIGFVCLDDESTKGSASKLAVDPEFRGKGYAQLLMKAAEAGARDDLKWKDLYVAVVKTKPRLLDLYKNKLGYVDPQLQNTALQMREGFEPVPVTVLCKEL
jgi:ribosomal protein S18 acetylase RimI-like enzyme